MIYKDFMELIVNSDVEDWIYDDERGTIVLKNDLLITIKREEISYDEDGKFYEEWACNFPDSIAYRQRFESCYAGNVIETFYTVAVDGHRMDIPYPKLDDMTITRKQYSIGRIVNIPNEGYGFDSYLKRAGITVK